MRCGRFGVAFAIAICTLAPPPMRSVAASHPAAAAPGDHVEYRVSPRAADPMISRFTDPNIVMFNRGSGDHAELVIFMPGTGGNPENAALLMSVVANLGYRVIGLEYNDVPAVVEVCPRNPDPKCSGDFREKRVFGDDVTRVVDNIPAESIVTRLEKLLQYLDAHHHDEHWGDYLVNGEPNWGRIIVSGLSQGAGMAAYIAKHRTVARVVLFSSPWDYSESLHDVAPWIRDESATPLDRWFAEYHRLENTATLIVRAYAALRIPEANIRVFDLGLPPGWGGDNPYHGSTIANAGYIPEWQFLFGQAP